ncbi:c-type cytochrome [Halarcobacter anaerophilus]|jgi:cytochrome c553|uniref:Cytochrome c domain-containing protein n=1 Tax=Halarcobacter anaerophilus TaxID=877500 RepID=A0A4Q0XZP7_9BACT|nr:c-type cytochrome [Halarcobacter anaerophilus]QDF29830.1 cytochrome c [Halarcobacter anaerophilus]RXJ62793.1 hypothetical protein CRV06_08135 [Halarcobacter anaerophilus]
MRKIFLSSIVAVALFSGCGEDKKVQEEQASEPKTEVETSVVENKTPEEKFVDQVKQSTSEVASKIAEESKKIADVSGDAVKSVSQKVASKTAEVVDKTKEVTQDVVNSASDTKDKIEESINNIVATKTNANDESANLLEKGKAIYLKCAGCHGASAEKPALGKSKVIKGWSKEEIISSLNGYKEGTYGGVMKGVMKSQVSTMTQEDIQAVAEYIATF